MGDPKKKVPVAGIVALSSFAAGFIIMFSGMNNETPVVPLIGFCVAFVGVVVASFIQGASKKKSSGYSGGAPRACLSGSMQKYVPVLADEGTKQDPEIQRLLQYTSVQKAFFDPSYLGTAEAQNDPNVRELLGVLDNIILERTANGAYQPSAPTAFNGTSSYEREQLQDKINKQKSIKNKPRKIVGIILMAAGFGLFMVPFFVAFGGGGANISSTIGFAPFGMVLLFAGNILAKL